MRRSARGWESAAVIEPGGYADTTGRAGGLTAAACVVMLAACGGDVIAPPPRPPDAGADFDLLFAPATAAEIQAVRSEWSGRSPTAVDAEVEASITTTFGGMPGQANVISHRVDGFTHYGAVFIPDGVPAGAPLVAFLHASGNGVSIPQPDTDFLFGGLGDLAGNVIYVVPSYRSEELRVGGQTFRSGGGESPWDRDVDDALAFIDAALQLTPQADPGRISAVGVSRGALVALLMAVRDPRIETVVELAGPTDFFGGYVRELLQEAADGRPRDLVGIGYMNARFLQPWLRGEVATSVFRMELVRRSAVLFAAGSAGPAAAPRHKRRGRPCQPSGEPDRRHAGDRPFTARVRELPLLGSGPQHHLDGGGSRSSAFFLREHLAPLSITLSVALSITRSVAPALVLRRSRDPGGGGLVRGRG